MSHAVITRVRAESGADSRDDATAMRVCVIYDCLFPVHDRGRRALVSQPRRAPGRGGARGHLPDAAPVGARRAARPRRAHAGRDRGPAHGAVHGRADGGASCRRSCSGWGCSCTCCETAAATTWSTHASFPYFSLLAAALAASPARFELMVDWFEVWSRSYWLDYLGGAGGRVGRARAAHLRARPPARVLLLRAARRAPARGGPARLGDGPAGAVRRHDRAGHAAPGRPGRAVRGAVDPREAGDAGGGRDRARRTADRGAAGRVSRRRPRARGAEEAIAEHGLQEVVSAPGFADAETVDAEMRRALCMLLPSRREGYGMVVVEAAARGTPSIVVAGEDNAATELIEEGVNGIDRAQRRRRGDRRRDRARARGGHGAAREHR